MLVGKVYQSDGSTPAQSATVFVRRRDTAQVKDTSGDSTMTLVTDKNGVFQVASLETGMYSVEAIKESEKAFSDSVLIWDEKATVHVIDTLKPTGTVRGVIGLSEGGDPRRILVFVFGPGKITSPDSNGVFMLEDLAESEYDLRIMPLLDDYEVRDTLNIPVWSQKTTDLDTLYLNYTGIPPVKGLSARADTLEQTVELRWNRAEDSTVTGYNVYRRRSDDNAAAHILVGKTLTDTFFTDTVETPGIYEYRITALDSDSNEGILSDGVQIESVSPFTKIDSLNNPVLSGQIHDFEMMEDGRTVIVDLKNHTAAILSPDGDVSGMIDETRTFSYPVAVAVDDSSNIYILEMLGDGLVQKFSPQGIFIRAWTVGTYCSDLDVSSHKLFVLHPEKLIVIDTRDDSVSETILPFNDAFKIASSDSNLFLTTQTSGLIAAVDSSGQIDTSWGVSGYMTEVRNPCGVDKYGDEQLVVTDNLQGFLYILNRDGTVMTKARLADPEDQSEVPLAKRLNSVAYHMSSNTVLVADHKAIYRYRISLPE